MLAFLATEERGLASVPGMSVGVMSATQGRYSAAQLALDISQGARIAASSYSPSQPPDLRLRQLGSRALVLGWAAAVKRAERAPQLLTPGLLASSIPGGVGYAGVTGETGIAGEPGAPDETGTAAASGADAAVAADRSGRIAASSLGSAATLLPRIAKLQSERALVVADLPSGASGLADLRALASTRAPGSPLIVVQRASGAGEHELLWAGAAGLSGGGGRELTSNTTNQRGLIAAVDIAPTILEALGLHPIPAEIRGVRLRTRGTLDSAGLRALMRRLRVVGGRRLKAFGCLVAAWAVVLLLAGSLRDATARRRAVGWALRVGGLAVLWTPLAVLVGASLEPSAAVEYTTIVAVSFVAAALTDALVPWPRAPLVPAVVVVCALVADALAGTQLLMRSLLGPNPILGARFYGFGNELKSALAVLVLAAVAGVLYPSTRGRRPAAAMACVGVVLAAIVGAARIGAGVGGAILVSAGFAAATVVLLPSATTRRRILIVLASPVIALVGLAAIDLVTAHGSGHYTGSILHARSASDIRDVIERRYGAAWRELRNHAMPFATALAVVAGLYALRVRERLLAPVAGDPAWLAVLVGSLTASTIGALSEDSGPVLLVVGVFTAGCVGAYLWGRPPITAGSSVPTAGTQARMLEAK